MAGKKRANGEGSIFKRKSDNRWTGKIQNGYNPNGKPNYKVVYGETQKEVKDKLEEFKASIRNNTYVEPNKITFGEWLDIWLNVTIKSSLRDTTWLIYESLIRNHIKPALGGIKIAQLRASDITQLYNNRLENGRLDGREGGLSAKTIKHIHQVIKGALDQAIAEKIIATNVADAAKLPKLTNREMATLNLEQIKKFLNTVTDNKYYKRYHVAYLIELFTGLRRGELLGLRWKDIDFKNGTIKVVQQLVKVGSNHIIRELKTESSQNRQIAIPQEIIQELKRHQHEKAKEYKILGLDDLEIKRRITDGLVFTNELGKIVQPKNFIRNFKAVLKTADLPPIRFHDMRHTFATLSLQQGIDIKTLQSDLGHSDISTTLDKYGHVNMQMKQNAANKRSELLKSI